MQPHNWQDTGNGGEIGSVDLFDIQRYTRRVEIGETYKPGTLYWSSYWHYIYEVLSVNGYEVTVRSGNRTWTHRTPMNPRDRVFHEKAVGEAFLPRS